MTNEKNTERKAIPSPFDDYMKSQAKHCDGENPNTECLICHPPTYGKAKLRESIYSLIGYLEAIKPGYIAQEEYIHRLNNHYIPNVKSAIEAIQKVGV